MKKQNEMQRKMAIRAAMDSAMIMLGLALTVFHAWQNQWLSAALVGGLTFAMGVANALRWARVATFASWTLPGCGTRHCQHEQARPATEKAPFCLRCGGHWRQPKVSA